MVPRFVIAASAYEKAGRLPDGWHGGFVFGCVQRHAQALGRRLASSLAAIRSSPERRLKRLKDLKKLGHLRRQIHEGEPPEDLEDMDERDRWRLEDEVVERLTLAQNMAELETEIGELARLVDLARKTQRGVVETKFEQLRDVIGKHIAATKESTDTANAATCDPQHVGGCVSPVVQA